MPRDVWPYPVPSSQTLTAQPWQVINNDGLIELLPTSVSFWDYQTDFDLRQTIQVDVERVKTEASLPSGAKLQAIAEWHTSASQTTGLVGRANIESSQPVTLSGRLRGTDLGGKLTLHTRVIVAASTEPPQPFVACQAGETLLAETYEVHLQGDATLFPISVCNFKAAGFDEQARWVLQTPVDPLEPAMGRLRLYLNEEDTELVEAAKRAISPTPTQRRLLDHLHGDVTRQLLDLVLLQPSWVEALPKCAEETESFGASLTLLLDVLFPNDSLASLVARRTNEPGIFAAAVQGALRRAGDNI